ncbi:SusC/RagA family TonB-linked outer membrane protein [Labilibacter marinus]|uniref:SusC/RagA family TonB-linked outer membrane protein n=1 Tax=Labilibacter marinus TaxID=1477105 RepID=UPI00083544A7|nr:TonB-dependent receptor [Labilibacter marinus]
MKKTLKVKMKGITRGMLMLLFLFTLPNAFAQDVTVKGRVIDGTGEVIPGVNIVVKGDNSRGTITDFDGNYSLSVSSDAVLMFRFIGYETQEVAVGGQSVINVTLKAETEMIDDVVVVGYGQQKKKSVVGAITTAKGEELLQAGSVTTISEALTGLLPGVTTMQAAGQPGSTAAEILIRGRGSWTDSSPLTLVDGVERDFNNLDPNEIESISVLKDASATAVYGVKGANGVILVTTKVGAKGKAKVSFTANVGMKTPTIDTDYVADMATNMEYYNMALMNDRNYAALVPQSYINKFRDPAYANHPFYQYTSFVNDLIGTGYTQQYNLNISGGNDFVKYFTSFGYNYDGDIFDLEEQPEFDPRTYQHRFNWRSNLDFNLTQSTKFSVKLSGDMTNWNGNRTTNESFSGVAETGTASLLSRMYETVMVSAPPVYEDGRLGYDPGNGTVNVNYLAIMEREGAAKKKNNRLYTDFILKQDIGEHFTAMGKFSNNYSRRYTTDINKRYQSSPIYYQVATLNKYTPRTDAEGNVVIEPRSDQWDNWENPATIGNESLSNYTSSLYYEFSLNYNQSFGNHDVSALALWQRRKEKYGNNFPRHEESWVGRVTYGFADKYLFEANGAYNGNENFAPGKRFGFFPSISGGWVLSEENFIKDNLPFVDFFKVRYSYGLTGVSGGIRNDDDRFRYISTYSDAMIPMEYAYQPSITGWGSTASKSKMPIYTEGQPPVPDVGWETATKQNLGVEINVLNNRLKTTLDLFSEYTKDILMQRNTVPNWFGNEAPFANMGETKNHGFDLELNWNDRIGSDISYWVKGNVSLSENRIVNRDDPPGTPDYRKNAGMPIEANKGFKTMGLYQNWDEVYAGTYTDLLSGYIPGDLRVNDYNADGVIDNNDIVAIGHPSYATKSFAFSFGFSYKNLSLTTMINGMWDISKDLSRSYLFAYEGISSVDFILKNNEQKDAWTPWNTGSEVPVLHATKSTYYSQKSQYSLRNASFVRLRNVELKYKLPKAFIDRTNFFDNVEFYVNGNNLYTWQKIPKAVDPEAKKLEVYPITKRYNLGCRFSF